MAGVLQEAEAAEEQRMEQEEDMWRHHENHRLDLERHQRLLVESERERAQLQRELEELRDRLQNSDNGEIL